MAIEIKLNQREAMRKPMVPSPTNEVTNAVKTW